MRQLESAVDQTTNQEDFDINVSNIHPDVNVDRTGSWTYDNLHPLANYWCVISCTDPTSFGSTVTGDAVGVRVIRENYWRDKIS